MKGHTLKLKHKAETKERWEAERRGKGRGEEKKGKEGRGGNRKGSENRGEERANWKWHEF